MFDGVFHQYRSDAQFSHSDNELSFQKGCMLKTTACPFGKLSFSNLF